MGDWVLVIPVKRLALAKTRLASFAGSRRPALALAFAADTVLAAVACSIVRGVVVVTDDPDAASMAASLDALVVADAPDSGLNPALVHGAAAALLAWPGTRVAALSSDLPALVSAELELALKSAGGLAQAFVADQEGTGTTLLTSATLHGFRPAFGASSAKAHRESGAVELDHPGLRTVRRDVDTEADLREALVLGLGPRTLEVLAVLPDLRG
jgi:2-phospho-L-lactate guanylyltransferase